MGILIRQVISYHTKLRDTEQQNAKYVTKDPRHQGNSPLKPKRDLRRKSPCFATQGQHLC